jgi:5-methylcytosine-specific restriction endonuclease McrA
MSNYPSNWKEIATAVKETAAWRCIRCGHDHDTEAGYMLTVHHIDMDKANCLWWNLAALCQRCHLSVQARVKINRVWMFDHSEWFRPYVAGYYAFLRGDDDSRSAVEDALIADPDAALAAPLLGRAA